jgi:hypothetical protein
MYNGQECKWAKSISELPGQARRIERCERVRRAGLKEESNLRQRGKIEQGRE